MLPNLLLPPSDDAASARPVEAQFTFFTSTKVQILSRIASPRRTYDVAKRLKMLSARTQYLYVCTSKASKLSQNVCRRLTMMIARGAGKRVLVYLHFCTSKASELMLPNMLPPIEDAERASGVSVFVLLY